ncbi:outer membrane protein assembly factor BamB family protein [Azohydromonas australica]|uniref:outer membrane protein assembly factor BamB family protein n=1 Tax=Azohydromonas australica TaxID=364039 RepID=UPI00041B0B4D|nr:PQQ-binding-like beta-propeller repeat protein [Azohydromonas australica]
MNGIQDLLTGTRAVLPRLMGAALLATVPLAHAATLAVQPQVGEPATKVDLRGSGMGAFETVELRYDDTSLGVARANAEGAFRADDVEIPAVALPGRRPIAAVGRSSGTRATTLFLVRSNWPQFHRGSFRHGEVPHENVLGPDNVARLRLLWNVPSGLTFDTGSPVVADGMVYILTSDLAQRGLLLALDAATGARRWTQPLRSPTVCETTPAVAQGRVYAPSLGRMTAFDARTGAVRWRAGTSFCATAMTPTLADGKLFTTTPDGPNLEARDPASGRLLWSRRVCTGTPSACVINEIYAPLTAGDGAVYVTNSSGGMSAHDANSGRQLWSRMVGSDIIYGAPVVEGEVVYVSLAGFAGHGRLHALDRRTGTRLWTAPTGDFNRATPALADGVLYVGSDGSGLWAIDARTGALRWRQAAVGAVRTSPAVANGVVYLGAEDGRLYALDARTGTVLHSIQIAPVGQRLTPSPAVADGVVYVGTGDRMMAFGLRPGATDTGR